ncbi:general substrate transporter [Cladorrhinum sp. PSN332]|nr:general substrate transporter [Cladorrhinum sp. PSN332]
MTSNINDRVEAEPLISAEERNLENVDDREGINEPTSGWVRLTKGLQVQQYGKIIFLLATLMFLITTSGMMFLIPIFRLVEDAFCHVYYEKDPSEPIEERLCKVDGVQKQLAYLGGLGAMINSVVGMAAALPYGVLADKIGRKPTFILSYIGIILAFSWAPSLLALGKIHNLYLAMMGSLFFLIGGGVPVALNSLNAMASDLGTEGDKATGFLYLSFGAVSGGLAGPVMSGILMETVGPWCPIFVVFGITPFVFAILVFLPETLPIHLRKTATNKQEPWSKQVREAAKQLAVSFSLLKNTNILLSLVLFFVQPAMFAAYSGTLAQYVSKYFGWTLGETSYLLSPPLGFLHLVILLALPRISTILTRESGRFRLSVFCKDLLLTKVSLVLVILGALIEGFSHGIALFLFGLTVGTLGSANSPLGRAVSAAHVEPQQTSRLFALISMLETSGSLIGGPVLAWLFNVGLSKKGLWIGLPWFYVAGLGLVALVALLFVNKPNKGPLFVDSDDDAGNLDYQPAEGSA